MSDSRHEGADGEERETDTSYKCAVTRRTGNWIVLISFLTLSLESQLPAGLNTLRLTARVTWGAPPRRRPWVWTWACWRGGSRTGSGARCSYQSRDQSRHSRGWGTWAPGTARGQHARTFWNGESIEDWEVSGNIAATRLLSRETSGTIPSKMYELWRNKNHNIVIIL